jgi:hypothetical protein
MSRKTLWLAAVVSLGVGAGLLAGGTQDGTQAKDKIKIGVYDNRSIAIAFVASRHSPVKEKMAAYQKAKAEGDQEAMKKLEAWGVHHQRLLHFQGFGHVPVADLLLPVQEQVRQMAKEKGLAAISMECDFAAENVELVDVTEDLVKLFEPSEGTMATAKGIRSKEFIDLVKIGEMPVDH